MGTPFSNSSKRIRRAVLLDPITANHRLILSALKPLSYLNIDVFDSGEKALEAVRTAQPELFVINLETKDIEPFRIIRRLKGHPVTRGLPIVVCTRLSARETVLEAMREGVDYFTTIPFDPHSFMNRIEDILVQKEGKCERQYRQIACSGASRIVAFGKLSYVDKDHLRIESNVLMKEGDILQVRSPIFSDIECRGVSCRVARTFTDDLYYHYQQAALLEPQFDTDAKRRLLQWLEKNKSRSVPKKTKAMFIEPRAAIMDSFTQEFQNEPLSLRQVSTLKQAADQVAFMRPKIIAVDLSVLPVADFSYFERLVSQYATPCKCSIFFYGIKEPDPKILARIPKEQAQTATSENYKALVAAAIRTKIASANMNSSEPTRIYLPKTDAYTTLGFPVTGSITTIGEEGLTIALDQAVLAPANLQLETKMLTETTLETFFLRIFRTREELKTGKKICSASGYFMALSDVEAGKIRKFVIDEDLRLKRAEMASAPKREPLPPQK